MVFSVCSSVCASVIIVDSIHSQRMFTFNFLTFFSFFSRELELSWVEQYPSAVYLAMECQLCNAHNDYSFFQLSLSLSPSLYLFLTPVQSKNCTVSSLFSSLSFFFLYSNLKQVKKDHCRESVLESPDGGVCVSEWMSSAASRLDSLFNLLPQDCLLFLLMPALLLLKTLSDNMRTSTATHIVTLPPRSVSLHSN